MGNLSFAFDPNDVATSSDAASSALAAVGTVSDAASSALAKAAAASSAIALIKYPQDLQLTTDTDLSEAQVLALHYSMGTLTNQGASGEIDVKLPAISYRVRFPILSEEAQVIEVGPPTDELLYLNGTALDANDCVDSDGVEGSMIQVLRRKDSSGNWHWYLITITGVWADTGASD